MKYGAIVKDSDSKLLIHSDYGKLVYRGIYDIIGYEEDPQPIVYTGEGAVKTAAELKVGTILTYTYSTDLDIKEFMPFIKPNGAGEFTITDILKVDSTEYANVYLVHVLVKDIGDSYPQMIVFTNIVQEDVRNTDIAIYNTNSDVAFTSSTKALALEDVVLCTGPSGDDIFNNVVPTAYTETSSTVTSTDNLAYYVVTHGYGGATKSNTSYWNRCIKHACCGHKCIKRKYYGRIVETWGSYRHTIKHVNSTIITQFTGDNGGGYDMTTYLGKSYVGLIGGLVGAVSGVLKLNLGKVIDNLSIAVIGLVNELGLSNLDIKGGKLGLPTLPKFTSPVMLDDTEFTVMIIDTSKYK